MNFDNAISKSNPAFLLSIDNKKYILKIGLTGAYDLFPYHQDPKEIKPGQVLKVFFSHKDYNKYMY